MRSKLPLRIGKRCKRLVVSTRRHEPRMPLARPRQGERSGELFAPVYGWFTEGFDTRHLKEAKVLLDELAA